MRYAGVLVAAAVFATSISLRADDPAVPNNSEAEAALKSLVERLEARIDELESQVAQLKGSIRSSKIGSSLLESIEPTKRPQPRLPAWAGSKQAMRGQWQIDRTGTLRDVSGHPIGYWGIDISTPQPSKGPNPRR